jgi:hypothetical protein
MPAANPLYGLIDEFSNEFETIADKLTREIKKNLDRGLTPRLAVNKAFSDLKIPSFIRAAIGDKLIAASALGSAVPVGVLENPSAIRKYMVEKVWPGDAVNFSARVNRMEIRQLLISTIRTEIKNQTGFYGLAVELVEQDLVTADVAGHIDSLIKEARKINPDDVALRKALRKSKRQMNRLARFDAPNKRLKAAYGEVIKAVEKGNAKALDRAVNFATHQKARYNAERLARTEIARAHSTAFDYRASKNPRVIAVKYTLSTRHMIFDICDLHTKADLYGMGPGVYPLKLKPPHPFHPHCMCIPSMIFKGEVKFSNKFHITEGSQWIEKQSVANQKLLLGVDGQKAFKKAKKSWPDIARNFEGHRAPDLSGIQEEWF